MTLIWKLSKNPRFHPPSTIRQQLSDQLWLIKTQSKIVKVDLPDQNEKFTNYFGCSKM